MKENWEYLSDTELELLIAEVEQNELVTAPPDLKQNIMDRISAETQVVEFLADRPVSGQNLQKEFYRYCFRVAVSVAAAVVLVFALPDAQRAGMGKKTQERTEGMGQLSERAEQTGIFADILNGSELFNSDDKIRIFDRRGE